MKRVKKFHLVKFLPEHGWKLFERNKHQIPFGVNPAALFELYATQGAGYTLIIDDVIVAAAGILFWPREKGDAWMLISPAFFQYKKTTFKIIKRMVVSVAKIRGLKRIQASVLYDFEVCDRFLKHLDFIPETPGGMEAAGPDGETLFIYARTF